MKHLDIFENEEGSIGIAIEVNSYKSTSNEIAFHCSSVPLNPDKWKGKKAWYDDSEIAILGNVLNLLGGEGKPLTIETVTKLSPLSGSQHNAQAIRDIKF